MQRRFSSYKEDVIDFMVVYQLSGRTHPNVYAYLRTSNDQQLLVVPNFFEKLAIICLPKFTAKQIILSNYKDSSMQLSCFNSKTI